MAKKPVVKTVTEATLKKEISRLEKSVTQSLALLKELSKESKVTAKELAKVTTTELAIAHKQATEWQKKLSESLAAHGKAIESLKSVKPAAKKPRKLSEMNIFVREQIKSGKSFSDAIQAWKAHKASAALPGSETKPAGESAGTSTV